MRFTLERFFDLWTFGVPIVLCAWAVLRLVPHARTRYVFAVLAFFAVPLVPAVIARTGAVQPVTMNLITIVPAPAAIEMTPILWLTGALLLLVRELAGHLRLRRVRRTWSEAPDEWRETLAWPSRVALMTGSASPVTVGLLRSCVALPRDVFGSFDAMTVRRIATHELAHARWRDPLVHALLRVVAAILWPSPLWIVLRWARREREAAADAAALRDARGEEVTYVAALLRLSRSQCAGTIGIAESDLAFRARRILAPRTARAAVLFVLTAGLVLASFAAPADFGARTVFERAVIRTAPEPLRRAIVERVRGATARRIRRREKTSPLPVVVIDAPLELSRTLASLGNAPGTTPRRAIANIDSIVVDRGPDVHEHVDVDRHVARAVHRADRDTQVIRIVIKDRVGGRQ